MLRRPLRIATSPQLTRSAREAGFDVYEIPRLPSLDFHRGWQERLTDGDVIRPFLESHDIELLLDFNTEALTLQPANDGTESFALTNAQLGIPYVSCYLDPVTSTMQRNSWADQWTILENPTWFKWIWERAHAQELIKLGIGNILTLPMAAANDDFDTTPLPDPDAGPIVAFMGHPATSWFAQAQGIRSDQLLPGITAAAVHADMPDLAFHHIYYDLYAFAEPPSPSDDPTVRAKKSNDYFNQKFVYNAYLAIKQRDRFARFLKLKLGDAFELIGDHWQASHGLPHTPRIWDMKQLHERMRRVPICLNLMKGCLESGLNIRHFEITAYGGFMLTYATHELSDCFAVGEECDVFRSEAELLDKIQFYLANDARRREMAAAGQRKTLSHHLYSHRIVALVTALRSAGVLPRDESAAAAEVLNEKSTLVEVSSPVAPGRGLTPARIPPARVSRP